MNFKIPDVNSSNITKIYSHKVREQKDLIIFLCAKCRCILPLENSKQCLNCTKNFCPPCSEEFLKGKKKECKCRNEFKPDNINDGILNDLKKLKLGCKFETFGCSEILEYKNLESHENNCPSKLIQCRNCNDLITNFQISSHNEVCPELEIECEKCGFKSKRNDHSHNCEMLYFYKAFKEYPYDEQVSTLVDLFKMLNNKNNELENFRIPQLEDFTKNANILMSQIKEIQTVSNDSLLKIKSSIYF